MRRIFVIVLAVLLTPVASIAQSDTDAGIYSLEQAAAGRTVYGRECAACHGPELEGGEAGPGLAGLGFRSRWKNLALAELSDLTRQTMPVTNPAGLPDAEYAAVVAYILNRNAYAAGPDSLLADAGTLAEYKFVDPARSAPIPLEEASTAEGLMVEWLHHRG